MQAVAAIAFVAVVASAASVPQDRLAIDTSMAHMVADPIVATFKEHLVSNGCYADASSLIRCTEKVALGEINAAWAQYGSMLGMVGMADMASTVQSGLDAANTGVPVCVAMASDTEAIACNTALVAQAAAAFPTAGPIIDGVVSQLFEPLVACAQAADRQVCVEGTIDSAFKAAIGMLAPASRLDLDPSMIAMVVDPAVTEFKTNLNVCYGKSQFDHCGIQVTLDEVNNLWNTYGSMLGMIGMADMATIAQGVIDAANADIPVCLATPTDAELVTCMKGLITKAKTMLPAAADMVDQVDAVVLKPVLACAEQTDAAAQKTCTEDVIDTAVATAESLL